MTMETAVDPPDWMRSHFELYEHVPVAPGRIGYAELQQSLGWGSRNRVKRTVSTLVGLDVLAWQGMRSGRAVSRGDRSLREALESGAQPLPEREHTMYPLLMAPIDEFITSWHAHRGDPVTTSYAGDETDGVTVYKSWGAALGPGTYTRPDLTVVVDFDYPHLGPWTVIHSIEVKPYWSIGRGALYEAIAQSALQRCTFSWVLAWLPSEASGHFTTQQRTQIESARSLFGNQQQPGALAVEAAKFGIGLAVVADLQEDTLVQEIQAPEARILDPLATDESLSVLRGVATQR